MNVQTLRRNIFIFSFAILIIGYLLSNSVSFGICSIDNRDCLKLWNEPGWVLFYSSLYLIFISLILYTRKLAVLKAWARFALWHVPLVYIFILGWGDSWSGAFFGPDRYHFTHWLFGLYVIISLIIITISSIRNK